MGIARAAVLKTARRNDSLLSTLRQYLTAREPAAFARDPQGLQHAGVMDDKFVGLARGRCGC